MLEPFVLPHQSDFSSPESFRRASGPANWNQQQGFYVYRANRLIQSGGWCRIRTLDEHTKLARVALRFSPQLDDAFRVNVAKMRVQLPAGMREPIAEAIFPVTKLANEVYRKTVGQSEKHSSHSNGGTRRSNGHGTARSLQMRPFGARATSNVVDALLSVANSSEREVIRRVAARLSAETT
jgi:hypothetical protein